MISTHQLTKFYDTHPAVQQVDMYVGLGEICGLIGPNGAGKTTLLKMLAGLLRPTRGHIEICGMNVGFEPKRLHGVVGYVPDTYGLYEELKVRPYLDYFARVNLVNKEKIGQRCDAVLELVKLTHKSHALVGSLSRGMRQRLVIAQTLLHAPKVLLLDEPSSGLDPLARVDLRELIKELSALGTTLIVSSHILTELADFCTDIIIMEQGSIKRSGPVSDLIAEISGGGLAVRVETIDVPDAIALSSALQAHAPMIRQIVVQGCDIDFCFAGERSGLAALHRELVTQYGGIVSFYERRLTVEDVFMAVGTHETT